MDHFTLSLCVGAAAGALASLYGCAGGNKAGADQAKQGQQRPELSDGLLGGN